MGAFLVDLLLTLLYIGALVRVNKLSTGCFMRLFLVFTLTFSMTKSALLGNPLPADKSVERFVSGCLGVFDGLQASLSLTGDTMQALPGALDFARRVLNEPVTQQALKGLFTAGLLTYGNTLESDSESPPTFPTFGTIGPQGFLPVSDELIKFFGVFVPDLSEPGELSFVSQTLFAPGEIVHHKLFSIMHNAQETVFNENPDGYKEFLASHVPLLYKILYRHLSAILAKGVAIQHQDKLWDLGYRIVLTLKAATEEYFPGEIELNSVYVRLWTLLITLEEGGYDFLARSNLSLIQNAENVAAITNSSRSLPEDLRRQVNDLFNQSRATTLSGDVIDLSSLIDPEVEVRNASSIPFNRGGGN